MSCFQQILLYAETCAWCHDAVSFPENSGNQISLIPWYSGYRAKLIRVN